MTRHAVLHHRKCTHKCSMYIRKKLRFWSETEIQKRSLLQLTNWL